jgi:hypothetical protein
VTTPTSPAPDQTAPIELKAKAARHEAFIGAAALSTGVATQYWLELVAYPPGSARSLWLFVDGTWHHLDDPNDGTQNSVQAAFCDCPDRLEVAVWYMDDVIVGLVVRSK